MSGGLPTRGYATRGGEVFGWNFGRELFSAKKVSAATYAQALKVLGQKRLVHMVALMSNYTMTSVIFAALDQQVAPDQVPLLPLP